MTTAVLDAAPGNTSTTSAEIQRPRRLGKAAAAVAQRALLLAHDLLGHATGRHLREARCHEDPLRTLQARLEEAELKARLAWDCLALLQARVAKIPERRRPYYTPAQRFRILEIKQLLGWSGPETAAAFLLCSNTIANWEQAVSYSTQTVGSIVKPTPPVVRFADAVRGLVQTMSRLGLGSDDLIARTLVRAGWKIAKRSVHRILREKLQPPAPAPPAPDEPQRPVKASFIHHVWMMDVSEVKAFLGGTFYMATAFDAFSRVPLVFQTFDHKPSSRDMAALLKTAIRTVARPKYVITDLGGEFRGAFEKTLDRLGIVQRFRRKDYIAATARLESFWRTLKNIASLRLPVFLTLEDLERRLAPALLHYLVFRPHQGLDGATPAELFLGLEPACKLAGRAPRARLGEPTRVAPFQIALLAPHEQRFPILVPAPA